MQIETFKMGRMALHKMGCPVLIGFPSNNFLCKVFHNIERRRKPPDGKLIDLVN